jgi:hypothetical protein
MQDLSGGLSARMAFMLLLSCGVLLSPMLSYRVGLDQGVFAYMGTQLLDGRIPYVDTWDHAFPGIILIHSAELLLFGEPIYMFRLFDLLWQLVTVWYLFRITARLAGGPAALLAAGVYCLIYQGYGPWNTAQREGFALLPVLWGFWLYLTAGQRRRLTTFAGVGLSLGLAVIIKPTMLALAGLYVPLLTRTRRADVPGLLLAAFMLLLPSLLIVAFYAWHGAVRDLYEACIRYQTEAYMDLNRGNASLPEYWWSKFRRLGGTTHVLMFGFLPFLLWARLRMTHLMVYFGLLGSVFAVFYQGTFAGYHYLPGLGIGAIMIGMMYSQISVRMLGDHMLGSGRFKLRLDVLLAALLLLAAVPVYIHRDAVDNLLSLRFLQAPRPGEYRNQTVFDFTESWDTAAWLREHTQPDDRIQVVMNPWCIFSPADQQRVDSRPRIRWLYIRQTARSRGCNRAGGQNSCVTCRQHHRFILPSCMMTTGGGRPGSRVRGSCWPIFRNGRSLSSPITSPRRVSVVLRSSAISGNPECDAHAQREDIPGQ